MKPEHIKLINPNEPVVFTYPNGDGTMRHMVGFVVGYAQDGNLAIVLVWDALPADGEDLDKPILVVRCTNIERGVVMKYDMPHGAAGLTLLRPGDEDGDDG